MLKIFRLYTHLFTRLKKQLRQGISVQKLSLTIVIGVFIGIIPILGTTTILCALAAVIFRLNHAVIQLVNYAVYPLQLIFIIPFIKSGEQLFHLKTLPLSLDKLIMLFAETPLQFFYILGLDLLAGTAVWLFFSIPSGFVLFFILRKIFSQVQKQF
jgi:uncharacterized protein (DUF2062 family)